MNLQQESKASMVCLLAAVVCVGACSALEQQASQVTVATQSPAPSAEPSQTTSPTAAASATPNPLSGIKYWAYQIQGISQPGAVDALVASHYDMLVLDPTRTSTDDVNFDDAGMIARIHASTGHAGQPKLAIAYVDIGEAENYRTYWGKDWIAPTATQGGVPDFMLTLDPDGWSGNYPVRYWDPRWQALIVDNPDSALNTVLQDGYDGIYLDWVEGFQDAHVVASASAEAKDPAREMIALITKIRATARARNPNFLVIQQNASALAVGHPELFAQIDGIAQEQVYFDGSADTPWNSSGSCDVPIPETGDGYSRQWYESQLAMYSNAGKPVFDAEYACSPANAAEAYRLGAQNKFITYVTRRPLDRLTDVPPPGY